MKRRRFLQTAGSSLLLAGLSGCGGGPSPFRLLTAHEALTLAAICEQIIPTDETPGAAWADVVKFIDRQLVYHYQHLRETYRDGLKALDVASVSLRQKPFRELASEQQFALLTRMEKNDWPAGAWSGESSTPFFRLLREHTMQGYYGDPRHGGNRDMIGWRTVGVPFPPVRGRDDYRFPKSAQVATLEVSR